MCILAEGPYNYMYSGQRPLILCSPDLKRARRALKAPQTLSARREVVKKMNPLNGRLVHTVPFTAPEIISIT